jgi:hypothetical protein
LILFNFITFDKINYRPTSIAIQFLRFTHHLTGDPYL